ncbi:MAG: response regulator [Treponema sp.]|nr:MAG: response regulator [Treponema sp.]
MTSILEGLPFINYTVIVGRYAVNVYCSIEEDKGSVLFQTDLPEPATGVTSMSESPIDVRPKVLIAEDDPIVALDLQGMVMRLGYDVVALVDNGPATLSAVRRFVPDIVLLDAVFSGGADGIAIAREIHATTDIPIVFCISSPDLSILTRAKEIAFSAYLLKPINPDSLATTLDTVLYKYKLEKRVQHAEEKFKQIAEKCEIMQFFLEERAAFKWEQTDSGDILFDSDIPIDSRTRTILQESVRSEIQALLQQNSGNSFESIRFVRLNQMEEVPVTGDTAYTLIAVRSASSGRIRGLLLPLQNSLA